MSHGRRSRPPTAAKPQRFFEKELAGEEPPSFATMQSLYALAKDVFARAPWGRMTEDKLVLVEGAAPDGLCYCSIMGALGEVFALQVYLGAEGYRSFQRMHAGEPMTTGEFIAGQRCLYVHFVPLRELEPPDRELLEAMGHPLKAGTVAPQFRSMRPGYHAWYPTAPEARILAECHGAFLAFYDRWQADRDVDYWVEENVYPLLSRRGEENEYELRLAKAPAPPKPIPRLPAVDESWIRRILAARFASRGVLEVDHFYGAAMIGEKHERKACVRIAVAIDARTEHAYRPVAGSAEASTGDMLVEVVLGAIESASAIPKEIHVRDREFKVLLDPLGHALGFPVRVAKSMPALELVKSELLAMMGDTPSPVR